MDELDCGVDGGGGARVWVGVEAVLGVGAGVPVAAGGDLGVGEVVALRGKDVGVEHELCVEQFACATALRGALALVTDTVTSTAPAKKTTMVKPQRRRMFLLLIIHPLRGGAFQGTSSGNGMLSWHRKST